MAYEAKNGWFSTVNGREVIRRPVRAKGGTWKHGHPVGVVWHYTAGCGSDLSAVFEARRVSAHFSVDREGRIYQYVPVDEVAWHADRANSLYIGIEHTAYPGKCDLTDEELRASADLVAAVVEYVDRKWDYRIPLRKINGPDLVPGFHDHADGDGVSWNLNRHTDKLYHWTWEQYLDAVREKLFHLRFVVIEGGKASRPMRLKKAIARLRELARQVPAGTVLRLKKVLVRR